MPNKLPKFFDKHKICIICEGNEEYEYLKADSADGFSGWLRWYMQDALF